jgi:hypothetical protein
MRHAAALLPPDAAAIAMPCRRYALHTLF